MTKEIVRGEIFDKFLEFSDMSSVFKILSRTEYIILLKLIKKADDNVEHGGKVYLEYMKNELNLPMSMVSEIVRTMSEEGWLLWKLDAVSKKTYIEVTGSGREKCRCQKEGMKKISDRLAKEMTEEEKDILFSVLNKLGNIVNEERYQTEAYFNLLLGRHDDKMNIINLLKPKSTVSYIVSTQTLEKTIAILKESGYATIPVISETGIYLGTISEGDILWYINENGMDQLTKAFANDIVNKKRNPAVHDIVDSRTIVDNIMAQNFLCMVDDRECFIGIITRKDIIKYLKERADKKTE